MKKVLFLDRDGIINVDHGYVYKIEEFEFISEIFELCKKAVSLNYEVVVITNQSGIGRGLYSENDFNTLTKWMCSQFEEQGVSILDVFFCPHHPKKGLGSYLLECDCRKPEPGMILKAAVKHNIDLENSIFIGDKTSDMNAAINAGINKRILVGEQYSHNGFTDAIKVNDIASAIKNII